MLCTRWSSLPLPEYSHQAHITPPTPSTLPRTHTHTSHDTHPETRHTPSLTLHTQTRTYLPPRHRRQTTHTTDTQGLTPQRHTLHHAHTSRTPLKSHTPPRPQKHTPLTSCTPQFKSYKYLKSFYMHFEHRRTSYHAVNTQCLTPSANTHISHSPNTSHHCTVTDMTQHHSPTRTPHHCTNTLLTDPHITPSLEEEITL